MPVAFSQQRQWQEQQHFVLLDYRLEERPLLRTCCIPLMLMSSVARSNASCRFITHTAFDRCCCSRKCNCTSVEHRRYWLEKSRSLSELWEQKTNGLFLSVSLVCQPSFICIAAIASTGRTACSSSGSARRRRRQSWCRSTAAAALPS